MSQWRLFSFLIISTLTVLVYYPSLWHVPRSDQIVYFFVTADRHSWASLALSCFDLNRWGTFAPGDERLFRPLLYFFLGTEKYLFGYNFMLWQDMGVLLHLMVIWFLMKLLWRMTPGKIAFVCALFFAMLLMNMEMVIWTHVHSYLIFVILTLIILDRVYLCSQTEDQYQNNNLITIAFCFLLACFIYETANIFAICIAIFLSRKKNFWIILIPPFLYCILDIMDLKLHHIIPDMRTPDFFHTFNNVAIAWGFWIYSALWFGLVQIYFDARNKISGSSFDLKLCYLGIITAISFIAFAFRRLGTHQKNFMLLIVSMMFFYAVVIVLGRSQYHSLPEVLTQNMPYYYPFWALLVIIAGALISAINNQWIQNSVVAVLVLLSILNGQKLYQINDFQAEASKATIRLAQSVEGLIEENKHKKDFSFYVSPHYPGNYVYNDGVGRKSSFIGMLFPQYYKILKGHAEFPKIPTAR